MLKLGERGTVDVLSPYDNFILPNLIYEVVELRDIRVLKEAGVDVLKVVYVDIGLTEVEYDLALDNNDNIYTLMDDSGNYIYVPKSYVNKTVDRTVYEYNERTIGVNLGLLPKGFDLTTIKNEIVTLIEGHIGVTSKIKDVVSSNTMGLNNVQNDAAITRIRQANSSSCLEKLKLANKTIVDLNCKIDAISCKLNTL